MVLVSVIPDSLDLECWGLHREVGDTVRMQIHVLAVL
jgi:hypothetical protein